MAEQQFSLCWDNFHKNMSIGMQNLLENEDLVDVTIAVEGKYLKAHKTMLSVCSPYFKELFQTNPCKHPIVIMKDVSYIAMNDLLTFMYQGEVQVSQEHLSMFIKTAEALQIKGLTGDGTENMELIEENIQSDEVTFKPVTIEHKPKVKQVSHPPSKRRRLSQNSDKHSPSTEEIIEFKMEPFDDVEQHLNESYENIEDHNETFKEGVEEVQVEDTGIIDHEDYSLLEGEDEAKPGTSNEVGTESQDSERLSTYSGTACIFGHDPLWLKSPLTHNLARYKGSVRKTRKRCKNCYRSIAEQEGRKNALKKTIRVNTYCPDCTDKPTLCIPCFEKVHC